MEAAPDEEPTVFMDPVEEEIVETEHVIEEQVVQEEVVHEEVVHEEDMIQVQHEEVLEEIVEEDGLTYDTDGRVIEYPEMLYDEEAEVIEEYVEAEDMGDGRFAYLKIQFFEPTDSREAYLSSSAFHTIYDEKNKDRCVSICTSHRLRVINKKTGNDHVTHWDMCECLSRYDYGEDSPFKILDWSTLLNNGFAENGSISFKWELNIETNRYLIWPFWIYSSQTLRVQQAWGRPVFRKGLKIQTEMFEVDALIEEKTGFYCSLSNGINMDVSGQYIYFWTRTDTKSGRVLFEVFISSPVRTSHGLTDLYRLCGRWPKECFHVRFMDVIKPKSELHFKIYLHTLGPPIAEFLKPKVENEDLFLIEVPKVENDEFVQMGKGPDNFFKSAIYKKKYQDAFEYKQLMQNKNSKLLPSEFLQELAENHDNEIECDTTLRYDSSDSNMQSNVEGDQVVFSDFKTGERHIVNKMILAIASDYFWMRFFGPHSYCDDKYVIFDDGIPKNFVMFLNHVYHPTNPITHHNFDALLEMAHRFDAYTLLHKLEKFLVFHENYSLTDKLKYANDFDLVFVLEFCLNSVKCFDDLEKLKKEEKFIQLPAEFKQFVQDNIRWRIRTFV
ncbi:hypothetical protein CAEBREN_02139 [Caenorhabditis brenneri]|uniref:BTB domain-containing protein n=1 Tax=Caenorhabditis brenneri TaxID=135651 RepID=G0N7Z8_CAEBE|nr:hypothetical protein CAEBREN_02139 [Caenorhabditis brenneri]